MAKKSKQRDFEALKYEKHEKACLTAKQYLVYSYLMSISKWDAQNKEQHYYVYKNSFVINEACKLLHITAPTWRAAIQKLKDNCYIWDHDKYYTIEFPGTFASLDIKLIRTLIQFGSEISNGGHIVSVYSVLYRYWEYQTKNDGKCEININQLKKLFGNGSHGAQESLSYKIMLAIFKYLGILETEEVKRIYKGREYTAYIIKRADLELPKDYLCDDEMGPDDISSILEALNNSIEERNGIA